MPLPSLRRRCRAPFVLVAVSALLASCGGEAPDPGVATTRTAGVSDSAATSGVPLAWFGAADADTVVEMYTALDCAACLDIWRADAAVLLDTIPRRPGVRVEIYDLGGDASSWHGRTAAALECTAAQDALPVALRVLGTGTEWRADSTSYALERIARYATRDPAGWDACFAEHGKGVRRQIANAARAKQFGVTAPAYRVRMGAAVVTIGGPAPARVLTRVLAGRSVRTRATAAPREAR